MVDWSQWLGYVGGGSGLVALLLSSFRGRRDHKLREREVAALEVQAAAAWAQAAAVSRGERK